MQIFNIFVGQKDPGEGLREGGDSCVGGKSLAISGLTNEPAWQGRQAYMI